MTTPLPIAVLISGHGSNLQAIIDAIQNGLPAEIEVVLSDNPDAFGLQRAQKANIPTHVVDRHAFQDADTFNQALIDSLKPYTFNLIVLAGFMRILKPHFIAQYEGRIINIHPSLLPKYPGLHTYKKAIENGDKFHGTTIHFVTNDVDAGPIITQERIAIEKDDTPESLKKKVQALEHQLYPQIIGQIATGKIPLKSPA